MLESLGKTNNSLEQQLQNVQAQLEDAEAVRDLHLSEQGQLRKRLKQAEANSSADKAEVGQDCAELEKLQCELQVGCRALVMVGLGFIVRGQG